MYPILLYILIIILNLFSFRTTIMNDYYKRQWVYYKTMSVQPVFAKTTNAIVCFDINHYFIGYLDEGIHILWKDSNKECICII